MCAKEHASQAPWDPISFVKGELKNVKVSVKYLEQNR
jgi:hypothetical protein